MSALRLSKRWAPTTAKKQLSLSSPLLGKRCPSFHSIPRTIPAATKIGIAGFHVSSTHRVALMPESGKPKPPDIEEPESPPVTELTESDFHSKADHYLEALMTRLEELAETKEGVEVDYSAGVLNLVVPSAGTYVLNKQPPNKQIWLSSPISGPKRFDWVVSGESQYDKAGAGRGQWVYTRDGTVLSSLLRKEIGVNVDLDVSDY